MNAPISIPACLFIGVMLLLLGLVYLWFERGGASYASRNKARKQMNYVRAKPRLNPRIEDDERELMEKGLDGNSEGMQEWQKLEGQDKGG